MSARQPPWELSRHGTLEAAGGKLISFYFTTGETDFLLISEADETEAIIAALLATAAAGTVSHLSTARAWTGAELKAMADRAGKVAKALPAALFWLTGSFAMFAAIHRALSRGSTLAADHLIAFFGLDGF